MKYIIVKYINIKLLMLCFFNLLQHKHKGLHKTIYLLKLLRFSIIYLNCYHHIITPDNVLWFALIFSLFST
jgi:hypothetical protein